MTSAVSRTPETLAPDEHRTTEAPCLICVTTLSLDDDRSKMGTVSWKILSNSKFMVGYAVSFECPSGHSSKDDPALLKAFPPRRFW